MKTQRCTRCGVTKPLKKFSKRASVPSGRRSHCKDCCKISAAIYRVKHHDEISLRGAAYRKTENSRKYHRQWRRKNLDKCRGYEARRKNIAERRIKAAQWAKLNPGKGRLKYHRRVNRERSVQFDWTADQWALCQASWNGCCAYCGRQRGLLHFAVLCADHFIPISNPSCPGTIPSNILPACRSCNSSKGDEDAFKWVSRKFGQKKAAVIIGRIERYFEGLDSH